MDMCKGLKELLEDKKEEGVVLGENTKLRQLVEKKMKKGCSASEIAKMLEEDVDVIKTIMSELAQ